MEYEQFTTATDQNKIVTRLADELSHQLVGFQKAYNSVTETLIKSAKENDHVKCNFNVLQQLTALLQFTSHRLFARLCDASLAYADECGALKDQRYSKIISKLRKTVMPITLKPSGEGFIKNSFLVSPLYDEKVQAHVRKLVVDGLKKSLIVLPPCFYDKEEKEEAEFALSLGCRALVSPVSTSSVMPVVTFERLSSFVYTLLGEEPEWDYSRNTAEKEADIDAELDELINKLQDTPQIPLVGNSWQPVTPEIHGAAVVPREVLSGSGSGPPLFPTKATISEAATSTDRTCFHPSLSEYKRFRADVESPLCDENDIGGDATQLSQVIRYKHELTQCADNSDSCDNSISENLDPSTWFFQISNSVASQRKELHHAIKKLGANIVTAAGYSPQITHLVVAEGVTERTESYLCCCAALKSIVTPGYVFGSLKQGEWILGQFHKYNKNPLLRHWKSPPGRIFGEWRVALFTNSQHVDQGITQVLEAGGCSRIVSYALGDSNTKNLTPSDLKDSSHVLVECSKRNDEGYFLLPHEFPPGIKHPEHHIYTLELLHYVLCFSRSPILSDAGGLEEGGTLPPYCCVRHP
uniref:WGS project CAEQ00000000 data, annotated contig 20 n=1 Tax=Trypanosoma congolense (strain IL3000) TaxID=1068625 RepID=F9WAT4_TRYCI|nr:unnamed protein product [Trypanosoma congolense IL3000]